MLSTMKTAKGVIRSNDGYLTPLDIYHHDKHWMHGDEKQYRVRVSDD
jgi:hypothetical protein